LTQMVPVFHEKSKILMSILEKAANTMEIIDIQNLFGRYTLDVFCAVGFGTQVNSMQHPIPFARSYDNAILSIKDFFTNPIAKYFAKSYLNDIKILNSYFYKFIQENDGIGFDLLASFKKLKDVNGNPLSKTFLRDIIANFMIAGRDTTALLLTWCFYCLSQNPRVEKKLRNEILEYQKKTPHNSEEYYKDCEYLNMVIHETLRLYPSVPATSRAFAKDVVLPDGSIGKKGDYLYYFAYFVQREPSLWERPEEFWPERWENKSLHAKQGQFIPFHGGATECLGRHFAKMEAKVVIAEIVSTYELKVAPGHKIQPFLGISLTSLNGVKMSVNKL